MQDELFPPDLNSIEPIVCGCAKHTARLKTRLPKITFWDLVKRIFVRSNRCCCPNHDDYQLEWDSMKGRK